MSSGPLVCRCRSGRATAGRTGEWMSGALTAVLVVLCTAVGGWSVVLVVLDRVIDVPLFTAAGVLEVGAIVQAVVGGVAVSQPHRPISSWLYVLYLLVLVVVPPVGAIWATLEHSRWGPAVLAAACAAELLVVWRLTDVWNARG